MKSILAGVCPCFTAFFTTTPDNPIYQKHDVLLAFTRWIGVTSNVKKERGLQPTSNTAVTVQELCKLVTDYIHLVLWARV